MGAGARKRKTYLDNPSKHKTASDLRTMMTSAVPAVRERGAGEDGGGRPRQGREWRWEVAARARVVGGSGKRRTGGTARERVEDENL